MSTRCTCCDTILLAPLVGVIDSRRAAQITQRLLAAAAQARSQLIIIDISGVGVIDDATIKALVNPTQALRLVGCRVTLTGITPEVALWRFALWRFALWRFAL